MSASTRLILEDGSVFEGVGFGHHGTAAGEVVFNTGMVGYPEALTDPSYRGQILALTYPLIGNYGVPSLQLDSHNLPRGFESDRIQTAGLIVSEHSGCYSHHGASYSLDTWLGEQQIPAIFGIDTRALTKRLREHGSMLGKIETNEEQTEFFNPNLANLALEVSVKEVSRLEENSPGDTRSKKTVVLVDCGCKAAILRSLLSRGLNIIRVPHDYYFLNLPFDGLVISNGPGDPRMLETTIRNIRNALAVGQPILGICLGNQLLARAVGAETYKMKFGHRSQNQPCLELEQASSRAGGITRRCVITSQNHGYAVREDGLAEDWRVWFKNANDGTVEGIRHVSKPFMAVQFHPEASPGPEDTGWIFDEFVRQVRA
ncbi:MAG: glutamine-hydrolyzing carbamoyl-phosphate synthase small subunit [Candidatus Zixiibacteriota bacterium]|nr:MAG: glutamine-hydrolyzing carbamoyl-phosphate synthase small subunit [candidate division Zixibacteria bacterium]